MSRAITVPSAGRIPLQKVPELGGAESKVLSRVSLSFKTKKRVLACWSSLLIGIRLDTCPCEIQEHGSVNGLHK